MTADITRREKPTDAKVVGTRSRRAVIIMTSGVSMPTPQLLRDENPRRQNIGSTSMDQATTVMERRLIIMLTSHL